MALIRKADIAAPVLPRENVAVPELGGDVVVRGLLFSERMALLARHGDGSKPFEDIPALLAQVVLDGDDQPIFSAGQWEQFGAQHLESLLALFKVARRLSGFDPEVAEKN